MGRKKKVELQIKQRKETLVEGLLKFRGIVTDACGFAGVSRMMFYEYVNNDPEFAAKVEEAKDAAIDFVEGQLYKRIEEGREASTIFYLKTKAKHRGYTESIEHTGPGGGPIQIRVVEPFVEQYDDDVDDANAIDGEILELGDGKPVDQAVVLEPQ